MKRSLSALLFSVLCLLSSGSGAVEPINLNPGLAYLRIHSLPQSAQELQAALLRPTPLILDLRYTADEPDAGLILRTLNSQPAKPTLYILVSPATPTAVAEIITTTSARLVTLGVKGSIPTPQVLVGQAPETDRRAYDALENGTPVETLISGKTEKERFDEAALVHEFKNGNPNATPPQPTLPGDRPGQTPAGQQAGTAQDPTVAKPAEAAAKPPALTDRVLQRAVHLHQALLALRR